MSVSGAVERLTPVAKRSSVRLSAMRNTAKTSIWGVMNIPDLYDVKMLVGMIGLYACVVAGTFGLTAIVVCGVLKLFGVI